MTENFIPNKKVFVFDTNVILHDFKSIFSFEETNIDLIQMLYFMILSQYFLLKKLI